MRTELKSWVSRWHHESWEVCICSLTNATESIVKTIAAPSRGVQLTHRTCWTCYELWLLGNMKHVGHVWVGIIAHMMRFIGYTYIPPPPHTHHMHERTMSHVSLTKDRPSWFAKSLTAQDVFWCDWEMGAVISCTKCSQVACLTYPYSRSSLKVPSLCAAALLIQHTHTHTHTGLQLSITT